MGRPRKLLDQVREILKGPGRAREPAPYGVNTSRTMLFFGGHQPLPAVTG